MSQRRVEVKEFQRSWTQNSKHERGGPCKYNLISLELPLSLLGVIVASEKPSVLTNLHASDVMGRDLKPHI